MKSGLNRVTVVFKPGYVHLILLVLLIACTSVGCTPSATTWVKVLEGPDYGAFFDMALVQNGTVLAVGATNHLHMPPYSGDVLFMKFNLDGEVLWERTWGGGGYEQALSVTPTGDGGYYVFGETDSYGAGDRDFFLLKITADGAEEWFQTYGGANREWPYGMLRLSNEDLLLYGFTEAPAGERDQYALRVGPAGDTVWEYTVESSGEELVANALETEEGNVVLAVISGEDGKLVELDADGDVQWEQLYELDGWQFASQIARIEDGGFLLAGFSMDSSQQADTWFARCASTGELERETSFGNPSFDDYAFSLIQLNDGTYLVGILGNGVGLKRIDEDGNILWERSLVGQSVYGAAALIELESGGFLVAGFVEKIGGRSYDAVILRTDAEGRVGE